MFAISLLCDKSTWICSVYKCKRFYICLKNTRHIILLGKWYVIVPCSEHTLLASSQRKPDWHLQRNWLTKRPASIFTQPIGEVCARFLHGSDWQASDLYIFTIINSWKMSDKNISFSCSIIQCPMFKTIFQQCFLYLGKLEDCLRFLYTHRQQKQQPAQEK